MAGFDLDPPRRDLAEVGPEIRWSGIPCFCADLFGAMPIAERDVVDGIRWEAGEVDPIDLCRMLAITDETRNPAFDTSFLRPNEMAAYSTLSAWRIRLEQERIPMDYVCEEIERLQGSPKESLIWFFFVFSGPFFAA